MGGSNLVIWEHTRNAADAVKLIQFLVSPEVQTAYTRGVGLLPVRQSVLDQPPFSEDPVYQIAGAAMKKGRTFPVSSMWSVIERRLTDTLTMIWYETLTKADDDPRQIVAKHLDALARRLEMMMDNR